MESLQKINLLMVSKICCIYMQKMKKTKIMKKMKGGAQLVGSMMAGPAISGAVSSIAKTIAKEIIETATQIGEVLKKNEQDKIDIHKIASKELIDHAKNAAKDVITHSKTTIQSAVPTKTENVVATVKGGKPKSRRYKKRHKRKTKRSLNKKH